MINLYLHTIIFTERLRPLIEPDWESRLHEYLTEAVRKLQTTPIEINGMPDHVHLLVNLSPNISPDTFLKKLKKDSREWVERTLNKKLVWNGGYGVFSISRSQIKPTQLYIQNQKEHHRNVTFEEEYISILEAHQIEYDPDSLFD